MSPLPTIADTWRITLNWNTIQGIQAANVFHIRKGPGPPTVTDADVGAAIDDAIAAMADPSHLFHCCNDAQVCHTVDILSLDSNDSTTVWTLADDLTGGNGSGQISPASAVITKFATGNRGPAHRGRMFQGPPAESAIQNGMVGSTSQGLMQAAWEAFAGSIDSDFGGNMVVASYANASADDITVITVETVLGTLRRRQNQLR